MPKKGNVAEPGFVGVAAGKGEINIPPVSVCHQVSTIGQFSFPIILLYHFHSGSLIGSPTVPKILRLLKFLDSTQVLPSFIKALKAVGAV